MQKKILIVDDEPFSQELLSAYLIEEGYQIITADDAAEARILIKKDKPDLILLDVMMPGEDGFSFCRVIKEKWQEPFLPVILVTALNDKESRLKGLASGADDFLSKPLDSIELVIKVRNMLKIRELHADLYNELVFARRVQETLFFVHDALYEGDEIFYQPCRQVGGDLIEVWEQEHSRWAFLADASGHGPSAALIAAGVKALIDKSCPSPSSLLEHLNQRLHGLLSNQDTSYYVTGICVKIEENLIHFAGAGHPPGLLKGKRSLLQLESQYMPLGITKKQVFQDQTLNYEKNDLLFLYSDGLFDIFGEMDLRTLFKKSPTGVEFHQNIKEEISQREPVDDISFLSLSL